MAKKKKPDGFSTPAKIRDSIKNTVKAKKPSKQMTGVKLKAVKAPMSIPKIK
jgi:hypothetical protein